MMTASPYIAQLCVLAFGGLVIAAAWQDVQSFTIPNRLTLAVAGIYPAFVIASSGAVDFTSGLMLAGLTLLIGFVLFSLRFCGGGDAKLCAAIALWAGPGLILPFALVTALAGGAIALAAWLHHRFSQAVTNGSVLVSGADPAFAKRPMPYGAAMAIGALYVALTLLGEV